MTVIQDLHSVRLVAGDQEEADKVKQFLKEGKNQAKGVTVTVERLPGESVSSLRKMDETQSTNLEVEESMFGAEDVESILFPKIVRSGIKLERIHL